MDIEVGPDDPRAEDVAELLATHVRFSREVTPADHSFALEADDLAGPDVTLFSARRAGDLLAVGALRRLEDGHAEIKSMHVRSAERGRGIGRALLDHLLEEARRRGNRRVSLETGTAEVFLAARTLYEGAGFRPCGPFGDYTPSPHNTFMTMDLEASPASGRPRGGA